jgi:hypothetical protein
MSLYQVWGLHNVMPLWMDGGKWWKNDKFWHNIRGCTRSFRTELITKYTLTTINTGWEATQRVMAAKLTRLTHKIAIQPHLMPESCTICSSRSRRPVRKRLVTSSWAYGLWPGFQHDISGLTADCPSRYLACNHHENPDTATWVAMLIYQSRQKTKTSISLDLQYDE